MLGRTPSAEVRRTLRSEVGFGCPVAGCRKPLLTWHHFDPPWHEQPHHNPAGMIALCREHHDAADRGLFSKDDLRALKRSPWSVEDVKVQFPWAKRNILIRLGGVYCGESNPTCTPALAVRNVPIIRLAKDENDLLLLDLDLRAADGTSVLSMEQNMLLCNSASVHDLEVDTGATRVKAWFAPRDVGIELRFTRVTLDELGATLADDRERAEKASKLLIRALPPDIQAEFDRPPSLSWLAQLPAEIRDAFLSGDPVGWRVRKWATANCLDDEQRIPLLDFKRMVVYGEGRRIVISDGIREGEGEIVYTSAFDNGSGAFNL